MILRMLFLIAALLPAAEHTVPAPARALLRFWSQASIYFPQSGCCGPARYLSGKETRLIARTYAQRRFAVCFQATGAAVLFMLGEQADLTILREERLSRLKEPGCESALVKLEQDYFGTTQPDALEVATQTRLPPLRRVFRDSPAPDNTLIERLKSTMARYVYDVVSVKGTVTVTVGRWVSERHQTYALIEFGSNGPSRLKEVLIIDPMTTDAHKVVLGTVSSPSVQSAVEQAILNNRAFTVTAVAEGK